MSLHSAHTDTPEPGRRFHRGSGTWAFQDIGIEGVVFVGFGLQVQVCRVQSPLFEIPKPTT